MYVYSWFLILMVVMYFTDIDISNMLHQLKPEEGQESSSQANIKSFQKDARQFKLIRKRKATTNPSTGKNSYIKNIMSLYTYKCSIVVLDNRV